MPIQHWSNNIWIDQVPEGPGLSEDLDALLYELRHASPTPHLAVDMSNVRHVTSSNLSQLLRIRKLLIDRDVKLRIAAPTDHVWATFLTTGLDQVFECSENISIALAELQMKA